MTDGCLPRQSGTVCKQTICGVTGLPEGFLQCSGFCNLCTGTWTQGCSSNIAVTERTRLVMTGGNDDKSHCFQWSRDQVTSMRKTWLLLCSSLTLVKDTLNIFVYFFIPSSQMPFARELVGFRTPLECLWTVWRRTWQEPPQTHGEQTPHRKSQGPRNQTTTLSLWGYSANHCATVSPVG